MATLGIAAQQGCELLIDIVPLKRHQKMLLLDKGYMWKA